MPYIDPGYRTRGVYKTLVPAARYLAEYLTDNKALDYGISRAFKKAYSDRRYMKDVKREHLKALSEDPLFPQGSEAYKNLLIFVYHTMKAAGFGDYVPATLYYRTDVVMSIDEIIDEVMETHITLPGADKYNGDTTNVEQYRGMVTSLIADLLIIDNDRGYYIERLERYLGNLLWSMRSGGVDGGKLDQFDRSMLIHYVYDTDNPKAEVTVNGTKRKLNIPVARDEDPSIASAMAKIRAVCQPGPWANYCKLISNGDPHNLMFIMGPYLPSLEVVGGLEIDHGPFRELRLNTIESISWGDAEQFKAFTHKAVFPDESITTFTTTGYRKPVSNYHNAKERLIDPQYDMPGFDIRFSDVNTSTGSTPELTVGWNSKIKKRRVTDRSGATTNDMIIDIATNNTSFGGFKHAGLNLGGYDYVDIMDESILARRRTGTGENVAEIREKIYYISGGMLKCALVALDELYHRKGSIWYQPAFIEYMRPSMDYFLVPVEERIIAFIIGKLRINDYDAERSKQAIAISHNVAVFDMYADPSQRDFDVVNYIRIISGATVDTATVHGSPILRL